MLSASSFAFEGLVLDRLDGLFLCAFVRCNRLVTRFLIRTAPTSFSSCCKESAATLFPIPSGVGVALFRGECNFKAWYEKRPNESSKQRTLANFIPRQTTFAQANVILATHISSRRFANLLVQTKGWYDLYLCCRLYCWLRQY